MTATRMTMLKVAAAIIIFAFLCLAALGAGFCALTLHVPRRSGPAPPNGQDVEIVARDGARLKAWWFRPDHPSRACVIVLHGIGDSRSSTARLAPLFLREGYAVLAPDSRAHGNSGGEMVTYGLLEKYDTIAWAAWMRKNGCARLDGLGESLGGSILIQAAALEPVFSAIVTECAYADLPDIAEYRFLQMLPLPRWLAVPSVKLVVADGMEYAKLADGLDFRQASPLDSIRHTSTPVLLIHGMSDVQTPPANSQRLAAINPGRDRLWLVPGAGHTAASAVAPEEFRARVLDWFATH